ncbi:MAG: OB-fold domain-containing protein [Chloroflexi bacterium]|nr:OB-fold domain-containing protein [Chloroflexota bacterium]
MDYKLPFAEYNDALKKNKLLGLKCKDCGFITVPSKMVCRKCSSTNLEIVQLKGTGKIQTFTTIFVAAEARECECPYTIVMVELDEGPWIMGNLFVDPNRATMDNLIGKRVDFGVKVFPGDRYSAGNIARPQFSLAE